MSKLKLIRFDDALNMSETKLKIEIENPEYSFTCLKHREDYVNDKLRIEGGLFLNDMYKLLGFQPIEYWPCD